MCNKHTGSDAGPSDHPGDEPTIVPVVREDLSVRKRTVETGTGVRVRKTAREREEIIDEPLFSEEVSVERIPINALIEETAELPTTRHEGEMMIIPVLEEVLVIQKRTVLKEELHVTRLRREIHHEPQHVVLRSDEVTVEHFDDSETSEKARNQD